MDLKKLDNPITRGIVSGFVLMSPLFTVFAGVPMIAPYFKNRTQSFLILFVALSLIGYLVSPFVAIFYLLFIFLPFFVFLELSRQKSMTVVFPGTFFKVLLVFFAIFSVVFFILLSQMGSIDKIYAMIEHGLSMLKSLHIETLMAQAKITKKEFIDLAITNSLASVFAFLFIFMFLNSIFISKFIPSYAYFFSKFNYSRYKLDDIFYILGILAIGVYVGLDYFNIKNTSLLNIEINIMATAYMKIIFLIFAFYGLMVWYSITGTFFKSQIAQRLFFIISVVSIGYFIAVIGFFDMWIDIRKLIKRRKK